MVATLNPTRKRRMVATALGTGASALIFTPMAHADTGTPLLDTAEQAIGDLSAAADNPTPAPAPTQLKSLNDFASQALGVVPSNLLRTDSTGTTGADEVAAQTVPGVTNEGVTKAITNYNAKVEAAQANPIQHIAQNFLDAHNGFNDDNTIGQAFGAAQLPNAETVNQISNDVNTLVGKVTSGEIVSDVRTAIDETLASPQFEAWQNNTDTIFNVDNSLHGVDRAAAGVSHFIDSASTNPAATLNDVVTAAGGPVQMVLNPIGSAVRVATTILGPDAMREVSDTLREAPAQIGKSLLQAAPALLAIPLASELGKLIGAPLGALNGSGIGGLLGSSPLNPLNWLGALAGAVPGSIIGSLATGIPGLVGSILATLPAALMAPLASSALGGAITAAIWATMVFGAYAVATLGLLIPVFIGAFMLSTAAFFASMVITGFNPFMILGAALISYWPVLLTPALFFVGWLALTLWIPVVTYAIGLIPAYLLGAVPGGILGALAGSLIPLIGIPLLTALSALPGALIGGLLGALSGYTLAAALNGLLGIISGAIIGGLVGSLAGRIVGGTLATPLALTAFAVIAGSGIASWVGGVFSDPNGAPAQIRQALDRGWRQSHLGQLIGTLEYNFYHHTESGRALGDLFNRLNSLYHTMAFLDGRRLRDMLMRGGLLGALIGAPLGAIPGGLLGALAGALNPLNLLNGLMGGLIGANIGTPLGATLGALTSLIPGILAALGSIPLTFLPNLLAAFTGWTALNLPALLTSFAATVLPPFVIAASVASLVWFPIWVLLGGPMIFAVAVLASITTLAVNNPLFLLVALPIAAIVGPLSGAIAIGAATLNTILGFSIMFFVAAFVGVPVFWLTLPFFLFPAVAATGLWALGLPALVPIALGASILESIGIGSAVTALANLINIPAGALIGGLLGALTGGTAGTLTASLVRALTYGLGGGALGGALGASAGSVLGTLAALITHLRVGAGVDNADQPTAWFDGRIVNRGGFGDSLAIVPGLSGNKIARGATVAIPEVASPSMGVGTATKSRKRSLVDASALVGA